MYKIKEKCVSCVITENIEPFATVYNCNTRQAKDNKNHFFRLKKFKMFMKALKKCACGTTFQLRRKKRRKTCFDKCFAIFTSHSRKF